MPTITGTSGNDMLNDTTGDDLIQGLEGDDTIVKTTGRDRVEGGPGFDTLIIYADSLLVNLPYNNDNFPSADGGRDGFFLSQSTGGANAYLIYLSIDRFIIFGSAFNDQIETFDGDDEVHGGGSIDTIRTGAGNDYLDGGDRMDSLQGGPGDDTYLVDQPLGEVSEKPGEGFDTILVNGSYFLSEFTNGEVEVIKMVDPTGVTNSQLVGNHYTQSIYADAGDNHLSGRGGDDTLYGLGGDDEYVIASANDVIVEVAGQGADYASCTVDYTLTAGASVERIESRFPEGAAGLNLTGNEFGQTIAGDKGDNHLDGGGGGDVLNGYLGNDTYVINAANDSIFDFAGQGSFDSVYARVSYALGALVEIEALSTILSAGAGAIDLTGNAFAQTIHGNAGANRLDGNGGGDFLQGFGGDDIYMVSASNDVVIEAAGEGNDIVYSRVSYVLGAGVSVEFMTTILHAAATAIDLTGNGFDQTISGNAGANRLDGGSGNDILNGFGGNDAFVFTAAPVAGNHAMLSDFLSGADRIELDDSAFSALSPGALAASAFVTGTAAQDADDHIIFDAATGALYYDSDGTGAAAAIQFATLQSGAALTSADIFVI